MAPDGKLQSKAPFTGERLLPWLGQEHTQIIYEHLHRYHLACELVSGLDVLDIACGEGYGASLLANKARFVFGVDCDSGVILSAQKHYTQGNLEFRQGYCQNIPLPTASVDVVVSFETIEHFAEHEIFLNEVARVLRPGGKFIVSSPDKVEYSEKTGLRNPYHVRELARQELEQLLSSHFAHVCMAQQKLLCGSCIFPIGSPRSDIFGTYTGTFQEGDYHPGIPGAPYLLVICSNSPLPPMPFGAFEQPGQSAEIWDSYERKLSIREAYKKLQEEFEERTAWALSLDRLLEKERKQTMEERMAWAKTVDEIREKSERLQGQLTAKLHQVEDAHSRLKESHVKLNDAHDRLLAEQKERETYIAAHIKSREAEKIQTDRERAESNR
jgi:SAM-dependent methyltransferase